LKKTTKSKTFVSLSEGGALSSGRNSVRKKVAKKRTPSRLLGGAGKEGRISIGGGRR